MATTILMPTMRDRESHPCKFCKKLNPVIVCFQTKTEVLTFCRGKCANDWLAYNMGVTARPFDEATSSGKLKEEPKLWTGDNENKPQHAVS